MINFDRRDILQGMLALSAMLSAPSLALGREHTIKHGFRKVEGEVLINGAPVSEGALAFAGDKIQTGKDGQAVLVIGDVAVLIDPETELDLGEAEERSLTVRFFTILSGKMLAVFGPGSREVRTPVATIGIRGTAAYIEAQSARTYACICYGVADLRVNDAPEAIETVATKHHEQPRFLYPKGSKTLIEKAPVINHTDAELIMLESLVHRIPPFGDKPLKDY